MLSYCSFIFFLTLSTLTGLFVNDAEKGKGFIMGVILDEHTYPVQNAIIYLNKESELIKVTTSDSLGNFNIKDIEPDTYSINVSYVGFFKKEIKDLKIQEGKNTIDIVMKELRCTHSHDE